MLRQTNNLPDNRRYSSPNVNLETVSRRCSSVETGEHQKIGIFRGDHKSELSEIKHNIATTMEVSCEYFLP